MHTIGELERVLKLELDPSTALLGINNRDLETFEVTLENTRIIMESAAGEQVSDIRCSAPLCLTPQARHLTGGIWSGAQVQDRGLLMLSESGIFTPDDVAYVDKCGCGGILVGESLVKQPDTTVAVQQLLA